MARGKLLDPIPILITRRGKARKLPWQRKLLFSAIATISFFVVVELLLTALGFKPVTEVRDPFVGFSNAIPLLEQESNGRGEPIMVIRPSKLVWFNPQSFPAEKPAGTRRVFCMGGSTTFGRPYSDSTSFCGWLREFLPTVDASCQWEVINAGGVSYASYRVASVMEELSIYDPDLFIVYSVHNEFLEQRTYAAMLERTSTSMALQAALSQTKIFALFDRARETWRNRPASEKHSTSDGREWLPAEVNERLNHTIGPADYSRNPEWKANVLRHYDLNLRRMVAIARLAKADIVLVSPASNEKDCSPFKSENAGLNNAAQSRFNELMLDGQGAWAKGDFPAAVSSYQAAVAIDAQHAEANYRLGKSLWETGQLAQAQQAFYRALNEDICPLRAIDEIDQIVHRVASELDVPLVEFGQQLRAKAALELGHACLGKEYFLDHVHPTIEIHQQLALWIIDRLMQSDIIPSNDLSAPGLIAQLNNKVQQVMGRIDSKAQGVALRNLAKVLHWSGKFEEAAPRASDALELLPNDPESRFVLADCLKNMGEPEHAMEQYNILLEDYPNYSRAFLPYGELLSRYGKHEKAQAYLLLGLLDDPNSAYGYFLLGKLHAQQNQWSLAAEAFEKSDALYPGDAVTIGLLQEARQKMAKTDSVDAPK